MEGTIEESGLVGREVDLSVGSETEQGTGDQNN